jgi:phosphomannomutase/phosphoglucomutase
MSTPAQIAPKFPDSIFRAYDIRGTVPEFLNAETAYWIGRAIGHRAWPRANPTCRSAATVACPARSWWN